LQVATRQTFTLQEVSDAFLPPSWTDGPRWLARRLNGGKLRGIKAGRTWLMRDSDIDFMLDKLSNEDRIAEPASDTMTTEPTTVSFAEALSPRSRAQLRKVGR
jgi:hypothetical protein